VRFWVSLAFTAVLSIGFWFARPPRAFPVFPQGVDSFNAGTFGVVWLRHALSGAVLLVWILMLAGWGRATLGWFWCGSERSSLRADFNVALGFILIGSAVFGLAFLGLLYPLLLLLLLFLPGFFLRPRHSMRISRIRMPGIPKAWLLVLSVPLLAALPGILAPEGSWDAMVYHLRFPSFWLMEHKLFLLSDSPFSAYPVLMEMHYALARAFGGGEGAAKMMHAACWILAGRLVFKVVRPLGLTVACAGALLWFGIPLTVHLAGTCYIDLATAWLTTLCAAVLLVEGRTVPRPMALLAGIFAGAAFMTKYTGAFALLGAAAVLLARGWKPGLLGIFCAGAASSCLFWLSRNWLELGNPVYPFFARFLGGLDSPTLAYWMHNQPGSVDLSPLAFVRRLWHSCALDEGGVGVVTSPLWLALSVMALLFSRFNRLWLFVIPGFLFWLFLGLDVRFLLPLLPVVFLASSRAWTERRLRIPLFAGVLLILPLGLFDAVRGSLTQFDPIPPAVGLRSRENHLLHGLTPSPEYFNGALEMGARIAPKARIIMVNSVKSYYIDRRCVVSHQHIDPFPLLRYAHAAGDPDRLMLRLRQQGLTHVAYLPRAVAADVSGGNVAVGDKDARIYLEWLERWTSFEWRSGEFLVYSMRSDRGKRPLGRIPVFEEMALFDAVSSKAPSDSAALAQLKAYVPESSSLSVVKAIRILLSREKNPVEALPYLARAVRDTEVSPMAWRAYGFVFLNSGEPDRALPCYQRALHLNPSDAETRFEFGQALLQMGARDAGIAEIETAVRLDPARESFRRALESLMGGMR